MRYGRLREGDREWYLDAIDEARENVLLARRDYSDALDALEELESRTKTATRKIGPTARSCGSGDLD